MSGMHRMSELPPWDRLLKQIVWAQLGEISGKRILDFGSGNGVTANHFAERNIVTAVEPSAEMLRDRWDDREYEQIAGDISALADFADGSFDVVLCHNVLEYVDNKQQVVSELCRLLKVGGRLSILKHNRAGRVMQMAVLLDDIDKANELLDGKDSSSKQFGAIGYYDDEQIAEWSKGLRLLNTFGIRTFWDLQQNQDKHRTEEWQSRMMQLEMRVSTIDEYRRIAFFHHLLFEKIT